MDFKEFFSLMVLSVISIEYSSALFGGRKISRLMEPYRPGRYTKPRLLTNHAWISEFISRYGHSDGTQDDVQKPATSIPNSDLSDSPKQNTIPLEVWKEIHQVRTNEEFVRKFVKNGEKILRKVMPKKKKFPIPVDSHTAFNTINKGPVASPQIHGEAPPSSGLVGVPYGPDLYGMAIPNTCQPNPAGVTIPPHTDPSRLYWPMSVRLDRCDGWCDQSGLYECAAVDAENVSVTVFQNKYSGNGHDFRFETEVTVKLERHLSCECRCKIEKQCDPELHDYSPSKCTCICKAGRQECPGRQLWDERTCRCVCKDTCPCHDDEVFNEELCRCEVKEDKTYIQTNAIPDYMPRISSNRIRNPQSMMNSIPFHKQMYQHNPCRHVRCSWHTRQRKVGNRCLCVH